MNQIKIKNHTIDKRNENIEQLKDKLNKAESYAQEIKAKLNIKELIIKEIKEIDIKNINKYNESFKPDIKTVNNIQNEKHFNNI